MILSVSNAVKTYGMTTVFENINFEIRGNEKIALVGKNGSGKTTLLKIICEEIPLDKGAIHKKSGLRIGYLAQMTFKDESNSVKEELFSVFTELKGIQKQLEALEEQLLTDHSETTLNRYANLQQRFEEMGGYTYESEAYTVITKFGFSKEDLEREIHTFSGGQKTKLAFAKLLLSKPDILLLDEPTNHLDLDTIQWLEGYLKKYPRSVVIVSHDRYFLDEVVSEVYEISNYQLIRYAGNYSRYVEMKAKDIERQNAAYARQQKEIERIEGLIEKFRYKATKAAFAQSKIKYLDRMEKIEPLKIDEKKMKVKFTPAKRGGKQVIEICDLQVGYTKPLCTVNLEILRGQRIAVIGPNGEGKSTFLKTLMEIIPPLSGEFLLGHQIEIGYFDQQMAQLNTTKTVLEELWDEHPEVTQTQIRTILGCFLFTNEDVFKNVSDLSGGEKVRLSLAKLMLERGNFLILDEPTNHLDIESKEVLEEALRDFEGTLLFVSHDRYFIKQIADGILQIKDGQAIYYPKTYEEFIGKDEPKEEIKVEVKQEVKRQRPVDNKKQIAKIEKAISAKEEELAALRELRFDEVYYHDYKKMQELDAKIDDVHNEIEHLMSQWEELQS
ncbi:MAG: ABC-F family ATP-binding cassette domain-containing protein [Erysipelotrichales bacterium]|nr:ABC-F family ATP-binding cassette domain-containing protein [Erysipelotrichales bacterium]